MKKTAIVFLAFVAYFSVHLIAIPREVGASSKRMERVDEHRFQLYEAPSKGNPYSMHYNIRLEEMGMITVQASIGGGKIKGDENPFKLSIIDARGISTDTNKIEKKYIKKTSQFHKIGAVNYAVDSLELKQTNGEYIIIISNLSKESHGVGTIKITYPAKAEKEPPAAEEKKPRERKEPPGAKDDDEKKERHKRGL